jgi:hypothetical protein
VKGGGEDAALCVRRLRRGARFDGAHRRSHAPLNSGGCEIEEFDD